MEENGDLHSTSHDVSMNRLLNLLLTTLLDVSLLEMNSLLSYKTYNLLKIWKYMMEIFLNWKRGEPCFYRAGNFANSHIFAISEIVRLNACHNQCLLVPDFTEWMSKSWPNIYAISDHYANSEVLGFLHNFANSVCGAISEILVIFLAVFDPCL
jgi:hypothetical protein